MKVAVITFHNIPNYGAALQAYALCFYLRKKGIECDILDYECDNIIKRELQLTKGSSLYDRLFSYIFVGRNKKQRIKGFDKEMKESHFFSQQKYNKDTVHNANSIYDTFIVGSDQVWNLKITGFDYNFFLEFADEDKLKISFASSIGPYIWNEKESIIVKELLNRFNRISVREKDAVDKLQLLGLESEWIEDPTFLLTGDEWSKMAKNPKDQNYVLVYYPNEKIMPVAIEYARKNKKNLLVIQDGIKKKGMKKINPRSPSEWLGYIKNASAVFTDSYHGLLFSLYMKKPVWTTNHSNRQEAIIHKLGIESCYCDCTEKLEPIDYGMVDYRTELLRNESYSYLDDVVHLVKEHK